MPAIGRLSDDLGVRNLRNDILIIQDGTTPTPNQLEILGAEGDLTFTEVDNTNMIMSRGVIVGRTQGDQEGMSVSFSFKFEQWSYENGQGTDPVTYGISPVDALKQRGGAAAWVSTAACGPYSVDLVLKIANVCGGSGTEVLTFEKFHADSVDFSEGDEFNTISVTGTCIAISPVRTWES